VDIDDVLRELRAALSDSRFDGLAAVYLFGSVARGDGGPRSDVDIALLYGETAPPARLREPRAALEGELDNDPGTPSGRG